MFSFCESVTGIGPWHLRQLSDAGRKCGGGIDTPSLCGLVHPVGSTKPDGKPGFGGWDLEVPVSERLLQGACRKCVAAYRELQ